ncbi:hypothetical protein PRNP1_000791 [Phytophthora ramorum]
MSSSSSSSSDEDTEPSAPGVVPPPPASQLAQSVELAQITSFCATFRKPLRLPSFSRTELQDAILGASNGDSTHVELLAELHFKLAREHPTAKMEKMVQDWEKTLARKLQENWRREFIANPMGGGVSYHDLTVLQRVNILDALCHWKLDTCAEIHKHIAALQKENDNDSIKKLRAGEIGTDDNGLSYWYFDDACWIYAEDKPRWQREEREPSYLVEFASAKRIRLSINFDPDHNSSAPPVRLPLKALEAPEEVKSQKMAKKEVLAETVKHEAKINDGGVAPEPTKAEGSGAVKVEKQEFAALQVKVDETAGNVKVEASTSSSRVNIGICAVGSPGGKGKFAEPAVGSSQINGSAQVSEAVINIVRSDSSTKVVEDSSTALGKCVAEGTATSKEDTSTEVNEDNSGEHNHPPVAVIVGSKKRAIIDDDSSDSSSDFDAAKATAKKEVVHEASSPPPRKKRKASVEHTNSEAAANAETDSIGVTKSENTQANGTAAPPASDAKPVVTEVKGTDPTSEPKEVNEGVLTGSEESKAAVEKAVDATGPASTSPTDPAAAPESFDITCESCKKSYDMRYVDPPLVERPTDEWRCFECLVNDARGWPRRRKSTPREPFSPQADGGSSKRRSSSSKARSGSSSSKKPKKSSSKSSSSKKKSSRSSSSKRKSSSSKSSSSKKSSSSSKKHKKRKSSSSSHHHSSSRRRHHNHYHHEEFAKLVSLFRERQEQRLGVEEARIQGDLQVAFDEPPQGWRVVSSTMDDLRALIQALSGGSLEQDRLRGRLILILKDQEKLEEQRRKQQELAWNILPRRQSSRIAIGRMRQSAQDSDAEEGFSDDDPESRRPGLRSNRSHSTTSDGFDDKQKLAHDRASRARRRHQVSDDELDMDDEDDEVDGNGPTPGNWIDWSLLKGNARRLSTVCLAFINRLLKEEASDLFSRPVDPALDGCPNYLSVIDHPMDLGTIRSRLEGSSYRKWEVFKKDVELVWQNCRAFNAPDTMVVQFADQLSRLSRSMCVAAEKKGVGHMKDIANGDDHGSAHEDGSFSDASKAESRSSVNKAWTESSASESSESSDGDSSSGGDSDNDSHSRKRRPTRSSRKKLPSRSHSTRSNHTSGSAKPRLSRSTRSRSSKKRPAPTSSSEDESSASEVFSPVRNSRRQPRGSASKASGKVDPPTEDDSSDDQSADSRPAPPQNGVPSPSPPPPPPPQAVQKRPKPRLVISDSSSSDNSSDSNSSSSSSDSDDSGSDARPATSKRPEPPSPSSAEVPAPPPPSPPPPTAPPVDSKPRSSPKVNSKPKTAANHGRKAKTPSAAKTEAGDSGYAHSQPLLNTYLSPSSSSSSDFSSGASDSSDGDSDDSD